jgi:L-2-hydroxyglutarate oxidase LhgO
MGDHYDVAIVGGGIVGLATALGLLEARPGFPLVVLEKEARVGQHQTGHNSGVVHSGVYYQPGSLKAKLCVDGVYKLRTFCEDEGLAFEAYGKVLVAVDRSEIPALEEIHRRGIANGVEGLRELDPAAIREIEPHAVGVAGLHVPGTASVDFQQIAEAMARRIETLGGVVRLNSEVLSIFNGASQIGISSTSGDFSAGYLVNCAGLQCDRIARMAGADPHVQIVPFRGEYYEIKEERSYLVNGMIYPVPDPRFPFLGVHFTKTVTGDVEAGPNAVLALSREGYRWGSLDTGDLWETLRNPGLWVVARKYWKTGIGEMVRSASSRAFVAALQRLVPAIRVEDVVRAGSGVRAQAMDRRGNLLDDFAIEESPRALHVLNAPSPAATASLAIGEHLAGMVLNRSA